MKVDSTTGALTVMAILALGLIAIRSSASSTAAPTTKRSPQSPTPAFSLFVVVTFSNAETKTKFKALFKPLARYVQDHEPTTNSYILAESDKNPLTIQILERYQDKENAFLKIHRSSEPFLTFKAKMQAMVESGEITKVEGQSYIEQLGYGFV